MLVVLGNLGWVFCRARGKPRRRRRRAAKLPRAHPYVRALTTAVRAR
jgi:hypothetical protein